MTIYYIINLILVKLDISFHQIKNFYFFMWPTLLYVLLILTHCRRRVFMGSCLLFINVLYTDVDGYKQAANRQQKKQTMRCSSHTSGMI